MRQNLVSKLAMMADKIQAKVSETHVIKEEESKEAEITNMTH